MKCTSTSAITHHVNLLVYGESGIGKTTLIKTAPDPLVLSSEKKLLALQGVDIPVYIIKNRADLEWILEMLTRSKEADQYQTICIDSLTDLAETLLEAHIKLLLENSKTGSIDRRMAYGNMAADMQTLLRAMLKVPKHFYSIARLKRVEDEATGVIAYHPSFPGKLLGNSAPYEMDSVFAMREGGTKAKGKYIYLQTQTDRGWIAKPGSDKLVIQEKPDLSYIFDKMLAKAG